MNNQPVKQKILIISYYWPPSGGSGVQRWLKFAKYLPKNNWEPVIITVDPDKASYFLLDNSLLNDVDESIKIYRTNSFEPIRLFSKILGKKNMPHSGFSNVNSNSRIQTLFRYIRGNLFKVDPRKGWNKYAYKTAVEIIDKYQIKYVVTTSPPHSSQLIGLNLKLNRDIIWIADLRDPWTDIFYYDQLSKIKYLKDKEEELEKRVINEADLVLTVSDGLKETFSMKSAHSENIYVVENGFDTADIITSQIVPNFKLKGKYNLLYVGVISSLYNIKTFFKAFKNVTQLIPGLHLSFVGVQDQSIHDLVEELGLSNYISFYGYVKKSDLVNYYANSDVLFLAIPDTKGNKGIVTGKIFEYMSYKKPIVAIGPLDGDAAEILNKVDAGKIFNYDDQYGLELFISNLVNREIKFSFAGLEYFSRENLTKKLVGIIEKIQN
ncbi:glycosyltransferase family 4 protein [Crocinitomix catalasitica]|uniref:glycosyltransferase family 4 protein n=1 Tax=Crocinitomix catalasitica TaxID=184607 RepID=UPI0004819A4F|nr:glycosyltransferase family 4 protein [Crocinitomix catalasitica]